MNEEINLDWYMDFFAKLPGASVQWNPKILATYQQKNRFKYLEDLCRENNLDPSTGENIRSHPGMSRAIETLTNRLKAAGIPANNRETFYQIRRL